MKKFLIRSMVVGALALAAACSTLQLSVDYDTATDFSKYRTFTLKHGSAPKDSIAESRLDTALEAAIVSRGLTRVPEGGDLTIISHFKLGSETQLNTMNYGYTGWLGWRWGGLGMQTQTTTVEEIPTGRLVVDAVDAKTGKAVWRGIAKDRISQSGTPEDYQKQAREVASELFANFPPSQKK